MAGPKNSANFLLASTPKMALRLGAPSRSTNGAPLTSSLSTWECSMGPAPRHLPVPPLTLLLEALLGLTNFVNESGTELRAA